MIRHILLIIAQELPHTRQLETRTAESLMGLSWTVGVCGFRLEFPSGLSGFHASDKGRKERWVVVVDQRHLATVCFFIRVQTLNPWSDSVLDLFVRFVLGNQMLKLICNPHTDERGQSAEPNNRAGVRKRHTNSKNPTCFLNFGFPHRQTNLVSQKVCSTRARVESSGNPSN